MKTKNIKCKPLKNTEWKPSDEMDSIPLEDAQTERNRAKSWMDSAAQFCRNEEYWRKRAKKAEKLCETSEEIQRIIKLKAFL